MNNILLKRKEDEEKLSQIQDYARKTLMPFEFTDEELFQISECITSLVVHGIVVPTIPIKIEKTGKKQQLTQHDLANFGWNIANQYNLPNRLTAQFVQYTFPAWFGNTTTATIVKKLKNETREHNIKIDRNIV